MARNRSNIPAVLAIALVCILVPGLAGAQLAGPCAETVSKFCKDVTPGGGRIIKCLAEHREDQSIACKDWVADQEKSMQGLKSACSEEIIKLCSSYTEGVLLYRCLEDNYVNLLSDCRGKLREIKDRLQ